MAKAKALSQVELLVKECAEMEQLMRKHSEFGANDSEPHWQWQNTLVRAFKGEEGVIWPEAAGAWELYTCSMPCDAPAAELTAKAKRVAEIMRQTPLFEAKSVREWLESYCWRIDF